MRNENVSMVIQIDGRTDVDKMHRGDNEHVIRENGVCFSFIQTCRKL
jgi:hypothetical protein